MSDCKYCMNKSGKKHGNRGREPTKKQLEALRLGREIRDTPDPIDLKIGFDYTNIREGLPNLDMLLDRVRKITTQTWDNIKNKPASHGKGGLFKNINNPDILPMSDEDIDYTLSNEQKFKFPDFEEKVGISDIFTQFNTIEFFNNKESRTNFIYLINEVYNTMIAELTILVPELKDRIGIMFKGGTTMRIITKELVRNFTHQIENYINELSKRSIKLSDYDFEIVSRKEISTEVLTKINLLTYLVMLELRNYLHQYRSFYFDFFKLNQDIQKERLISVMEKGNKLFSSSEGTFKDSVIDFIEFGDKCSTFNKKVFTHDVTFQQYQRYKYLFQTEEKDQTSECRTDFMIISSMNEDDSNVGVASSHVVLKKYYNLPDEIVNLAIFNRGMGKRLYSTHNPNISFKNGGLSVNFALNRIKFSYTLYITSPNGKYKLDIPGEVLDLSHALTADRRKNSYDKPIHQLEFLQQFSFINNDLKYLSYNLFGHYKDINSIIFAETSYEPWTDHKYEKRLARLILISILAFFQVKGKTYKSKLKTVDNMISSIKSGEKLDNISDFVILNDLYNNIFLSINSSNESKLFINKVIMYIEMLLNAFKAQHYQTFNQVFTTDKEGLSNMSLTLDYEQLY